MIRLMLLPIIILLAFLTYGVYKLDFGKKHYDLSVKMFPSFLIWPKDPMKYELVGKVFFPILLVIFIVIFFIIPASW